MAFFLRTYRLSSLPPGFHVDEVKAGWNAYSLWLTGRDDWLHPFPLHYDTFGDQRPTGLFYAMIPSLKIFGLTQFAVRFTPALFGSLAVFAVFFLTFLITQKSKLATLSALMLAVSPWHITLSRATSEGIVSVTLILFGLYFLIRSLRSRTLSPLVLSGIFLILSYFFYHTSRLLVPVFVITVMTYSYITSVRHRIFLPGLILLLILSAVTCLFLLSPVARSRLSQVSVFSDPGVNFELQRLPFEEGPNRVFTARAFHNKIQVFTGRFLDEYAQYFSSGFYLTAGEAKPVRYQTASRGLILYIELILILAGLTAVAGKKLSCLPVLLLLVSPLPAAITTEDAPNLHRALLMTPFLSILAASGFWYIYRVKHSLIFIVTVLFLLDFVHYTHLYLVHNPRRDNITLSRNAGVTELIEKISGYRQEYPRIFLTNRPDHLYPWYAFLTARDPRVFNQLIAVNKNAEFTWEGLTFSQHRCPSEFLSAYNLPRALAVDTEGCPVNTSLTQVDSVSRDSGGHPYTLWTVPSL